MTKDEYKKDIIRKMRSLSIYKKEFAHAIDGFARALADQEKTLELFDKSGGQIMIKHTNKAGATNAVKNPFYLALETLRVDILSYSRELGLTPAALKKLQEGAFATTKKSGLVSILEELGAG